MISFRKDNNFNSLDSLHISYSISMFFLFEANTELDVHDHKKFLHIQ